MSLKRKYLDLVASTDESLAEHDKKYHPKGWKKGDRCKVRGKAERDDESDRLSDATGWMADWIDGLNIELVDEDSLDVDPTDSDVRMMMTGIREYLEKKGQAYVDGTVFDSRYEKVAGNPFKKILPAIHTVSGIPIAELDKARTIFYARGLHCLLPTDTSKEVNRGKSLNGHGATVEQMYNAFKKLDDGDITVVLSDTRPTEVDRAVVVRAIVKSPFGDPSIPERFGDYTLIIAAYNDTREAIRDFRYPFLTYMTMYPVDKQCCEKIVSQLKKQETRTLMGDRGKCSEFIKYMGRRIKENKKTDEDQTRSDHTDSQHCLEYDTSQDRNSSDTSGSVAKSESGVNGDSAKESIRALLDVNRTCTGYYNRKTGNVVLVKGKADAKTVAHEIGWHATYHWAEKNAPELYRKLKSYAKTATKSVKEAVRKRYGGNLSEDALLDEIGAERFTRDHMGVIEDAIEKSRTDKWWDGVEGACDETRIAFVARQELSDSEIANISKMEPKKAVEALVEAMINGRKLGRRDARSSQAEYLEMTRRE